MINPGPVGAIIRSTQPIFATFKPEDRQNVSADQAAPYTQANKIIAEYVVDKLPESFQGRNHCRIRTKHSS